MLLYYAHKTKFYEARELTTLTSSKESAGTRKRRATSHRRSPRTVAPGSRTSSTGRRAGPT